MAINPYRKKRGAQLGLLKGLIISVFNKIGPGP